MAIDTDCVSIPHSTKMLQSPHQKDTIPKLEIIKQSDKSFDSDDESDLEEYNKETRVARISEKNNSSSKIENVTVKKSTGVHIGTRQIFNGPVIIKKLIGPKLDENGMSHSVGAINHGFTIEGDGTYQGHKFGESTVGNIAPEKDSWKCFGYTCLPASWNLHMRTVIIVCTCVVFAIVLSLVLSITLMDKDSNREKVLLLSKALRIVSRQEWIAQPPSEELAPLETPVPYVIITHTATENCTDQASCVFHVRFIQTFHLESRGWSDIGYNFLVGGDGSVYEGRGWDKMGAHTKSYNDRSIGIAFIGTFNSIIPPERQIVAAQKLIELGVGLGKISKDYKLFGHRQLFATLSPGDKLFEEIQKWPHWSKEL